VAYNNIISRVDAQARIPEQVSNEILVNLANESAALKMFKRTTMSTNQTRMPVLAALPTAYFVSGDTGLKQTTEVNWANKYLNAEELAAIVPIPQAVLDDAGFDIWAEIRPLLEQAIGRAIDAAIFFNVNKPASWPTAIAAAAIAAGNTAVRGASAAAIGGIAQDVNLLMGFVEADGYTVNGFVAPTAYKARLRGARDTTGQQVMDVSLNTIYGLPVAYAMAGQWPASATGVAELFAGDWSQQIIAVRRDFDAKILDQAVIQDNTGAIIYNLAQQDMVAMRLTFRVAWQTANTLNYEGVADANRYPAAVLTTP
jgi:HK97 family phage major capsid protein